MNRPTLRAIEDARRYDRVISEPEGDLILHAAKHGQRQQAEVAALTAASMN